MPLGVIQQSCYKSSPLHKDTVSSMRFLGKENYGPLKSRASQKSCKGSPSKMPPPKRQSLGPMSRRNERERNRVKLLNLGFARLRAVVPAGEGESLSKISTLKKAIWYIEHLDRVLKETPEVDECASKQSGLVEVVGMDSKQLGAPCRETGSGDGAESANFGSLKRIPSPVFPERMEGNEACSLVCREVSTSEARIEDSGYGSFVIRPVLGKPERSSFESPLFKGPVDYTITPLESTPIADLRFYYPYSHGL